MTRGKIDQVETKTSKNGREFRRVKVGNSWLSCWDAKLFPLLVAGAELDYETQDRQGFANLTAATAVGPPPPAAQANGSEPTIGRELLIVRQACLHAATRVLAGRFGDAPTAVRATLAVAE